MAVAPKGIDVRQSTNRLLFRALLQTSAGAVVTAGTTSLYIYEIQDDGTLRSYDFNDNTFKTTALTTETLAMTHRQGNNGTTNTGLWSVPLTTLTGFTVAAVYLARITNSGASPTDQMREFQFGGQQGDQLTGTLLTKEYILNVDSPIAGSIEEALSFLEVTICLRATAQAGAASTITLNAGASTVNQFYTGFPIYTTGGTGAGQFRTISGYIGGTKVATVSNPWAVVPDNTTKFIILDWPYANVGVWMDAIPNVLQAGRVDSYVGAMANGVIAAATFAANALAAVWAVTTASLTTAGTIGKALVDMLAAYTTARAPKLDFLDVAISSRMATFTYTAPDNAGIAAINAALAARLDVAVSSRMAAFTYVPPDNASIAAISAFLVTNIDVVLSTRMAASSYVPPNNAGITTIGNFLVTNIDVVLSTRMAGSAYVAPDNNGIAAMHITTDRLETTWQLNAGAYRFTAPALALAPSGGGGGGGGPIGPGATLCTLTFEEPVGVPLPDADVWITSDASGTTTIAGTSQTNGAGKVQFMLDIGVTYYVWMQKDGVNPLLGSPYTP